MHCNGQCILMKKFQQHENKDQQAPERKQENNSDPYAFNWVDPETNGLFLSAKAVKYPPYTSSFTSSFARYCFRPPDDRLI